MPAMMAAAPYEIRTGGDGKSKKQSMAELKLRRLTELNQRLREDLERRRIPVSEAALEYACPPLIERGSRPHES
jgi:guanine nucleotide-binding protein subunit gamma